MLIFSNSMCKSASTLIWWYTEKLVYATHPKNGGAALRELTDSGELAGGGGYIAHPLTEEKIDRLIELAKNQGPTVVKVHCFLTPYLREVLESGDAMATFCYRDPRDMILSAMDHRVRAAKQGRDVFGKFTTVKDSLDEAVYWCRMSCTWHESRLAELFQYVDTVARPIWQMRRLAEFFNVDASDALIEEVQAVECRQKSVGWCEFNKGDLSRYTTEMNSHEIKICNQYLGKYIRQLGFSIDNTATKSDEVDIAA